jgi:hypothetical protein
MSTILNPFFNSLAGAEKYRYFQQDNSAALTAHKSMLTVFEAFENVIISKDWPPMPPESRYSEYYLWIFEGRAYKNDAYID